MLMVGALFALLLVYLHGIGYTPVESGSVLSLATFSYLVVQALAGHLSDNIDTAKMKFVGLLLAGLAINTVTFTARVPLIGVLTIARVGIATIWTNSDALVSTLATKGQLSASVGAAESSKNLATCSGGFAARRN